MRSHAERGNEERNLVVDIVQPLRRGRPLYLP